MLYYTVLNFLCLIMANSVKQFCCLFRYLIYDTALIKQNCLIKLYGKPILILFFISTVQLKHRPMGLGLTSKLSMVQPWKGLTELNKILMLMRFGFFLRLTRRIMTTMIKYMTNTSYSSITVLLKYLHIPFGKM